jgi:hypothetical protein
MNIAINQSVARRTNAHVYFTMNATGEVIYHIEKQINGRKVTKEIQMPLNFNLDHDDEAQAIEISKRAAEAFAPEHDRPKDDHKSEVKSEAPGTVHQDKPEVKPLENITTSSDVIGAEHIMKDLDIHPVKKTTI